MTISEAIARCAIMRQETRGAHFRLDFPANSEEFSKLLMVIIKDADCQMQVLSEAIVPLPEETKQLTRYKKQKEIELKKLQTVKKRQE